MYIYIYLYIFIEKEKECFSLFLSPFALFSSFCCFLSRRVLFDTQKKKKEKLRGECGGLCVSGRVFFFSSILLAVQFSFALLFYSSSLYFISSFFCLRSSTRWVHLVDCSIFFFCRPAERWASQHARLAFFFFYNLGSFGLFLSLICI